MKYSQIKSDEIEDCVRSVSTLFIIISLCINVHVEAPWDSASSDWNVESRMEFLSFRSIDYRSNRGIKEKSREMKYCGYGGFGP